MLAPAPTTSRRLPWVACRPCLLTLATLAAGGCRPEASPRPLAVVASGDMAGWIVPCGCASNQSGGLLRRATYMAHVRAEQEAIAVDVGGAPGGTSPYDRARWEAAARGEAAMGVSVHNIGRSEAALGAEALRHAAETIGLPLVSANATDRQGRPIAPPLRIVEAAGRRVAIAGVLSPQFATPDIRVAEPRQAILDTVPGAGRYDALIVLAYLPEDELRQLAETLPEADAVVGGPTGQTLGPVRVGPMVLTSATNQGKFLVRLDAPSPAAADRWSASMVELDKRFADDAAQAANLRAFYAQLAERDFAPQETSFAPPLPAQLPEGYAVAGTARCRKCHEDDCRAWDASGHARAWKSLEAKGAHVDPDCQRCHTTGYGQPGGFASARRSPERVDVGCEGCHGPSHEHAADPKNVTPHFAQAKNHCTGCHDRENSPKFELEAYWQRIRHGDDTPRTHHAPRDAGHDSNRTNPTHEL